MALGDYANSRGAADMGLLPDLSAGLCFASRMRQTHAKNYGKIWGAKLSATPGLTLAA